MPSIGTTSILDGQEHRRHRAICLGDDPETVSRRQVVRREETSAVFQRVVVGRKIVLVHVSPVTPDMPIQQVLRFDLGPETCLDGTRCRQQSSQ